MDQRLISWALAVKALTAKAGPASFRNIPPLWLFTDDVRLPDPRAVVARLPKGLCGVVLRHDQAPDRAALARDLARLCRDRRNLLVVAGDWKLAHALRAGVHLRGGRALPYLPHQPGRVITASAHSRAEAVRARSHGAVAAFVSPLFATRSHRGAAPLGLLRALAIGAPLGPARFVLGGVDRTNLRRLPVPMLRGFGGISCF